MLVSLRRRKVEAGHDHPLERMGMKGFGTVMSNVKVYHRALKLGKLGQKVVVRDGGIRAKIGPLKGWNSHRVAPSISKQLFREQYGELRSELDQQAKAADPAVAARMREWLTGRDGGASHE